jgi:penicillin G amidase
MRARTTGLTILAVATALAAPVAAQGRVITAQTVLPPGQSGFVPLVGTNPHLYDQIPLFERFDFKPAGFDEPAASTESPKAGVTITRDAYDVPDVHGATDRDAWFGAGYAIAQDRMVQLELFRRGTKGTLAEVLGKSRLPSDIEARRDYYTDAELRTMLKRVPSPLRARFGAYADGINAYAAKVAANPALQPKEFTLLGLKFAKWTALDSVRIGIQLARTIPSSDGAELDNWTALRKLGAKRFDRLLPVRRKGELTTVPAAYGRFPSTPGRTVKDERKGFANTRRFLAHVKPPKATASAASVSAPPGQLPAHGGSNAWAVRGPGHKSYLFHGPQLGFAVPDTLVELEVHRPGLDVRGVTAPGLPVIGIGRNAHIAWAETSGLSDDDDLYVEKLKGADRYVYKGKVRRMSCRTETFKASDAPTQKIKLCRTVHGPVQERSGSKWAFARRYAIWGHEMDTLTGLAQLNEASSVKQAGKAIAKVSWNENSMVADDKGNIGWWHPGRLPNKPLRWDERLPMPGTGQAEWRGLLKFKQTPHVINPKQGWLANWNNLPSAGWTNGDAEAKERIVGRLHRANYLARLVAGAAKHPSFDAVKAVDRSTGTIAQQRPLYAAQLRKADGGATGTAKSLLDTILAWNGSYNEVDANNTVDPGLAAWNALKDALVKRELPAAARSWLGAPGSSHQEDAGGAAGTALLEAGPGDLRAAATTAATALAKRFGNVDPASWRDPRPMYDVSITGIADKPQLKFFDRGTWQQAVELGP